MIFQPVWTEIDLMAIASNVRELRKIVNPNAHIMAIVKANAYGHGMIEVSKTALQNGANALGVARICEAIDIRNAGINVPVLILGYTPPSLIKELLNYDITQTIYSLEVAKALSQEADKYGRKLKVHLKIDTGMGRVGVLPVFSHGLENREDIIETIKKIKSLKGLNLEGIYTHFATADEQNREYANLQFKVFKNLLDQLYRENIDIPVQHAANSAAIFEMPETHLNMVRAGISIYGLSPSNYMRPKCLMLKPAMEFKSKIVHLKKVASGFKVSYGVTYETKNPTTIATVSIGYADGFNRLLSSAGHMLVRGQRAPVIGRVCMDQIMLDVGHIPNVCLEDEVIIFGTQNNESITVDEIADQLNTINYEIVTNVTNRVPRLYLE